MYGLINAGVYHVQGGTLGEQMLESGPVIKTSDNPAIVTGTVTAAMPGGDTGSITVLGGSLTASIAEGVTFANPFNVQQGSLVLKYLRGFHRHLSDHDRLQRHTRFRQRRALGTLTMSPTSGFPATGAAVSIPSNITLDVSGAHDLFT